MSTSNLGRIKEAHRKSEAPGEVLGFLGSGYYRVRIWVSNAGYITRNFRFRSHRDGRVTVKPSWQIAGDRQRKQATA